MQARATREKTRWLKRKDERKTVCGVQSKARREESEKETEVHRKQVKGPWEKQKILHLYPIK